MERGAPAQRVPTGRRPRRNARSQDSARATRLQARLSPVHIAHRGRPRPLPGEAGRARYRNRRPLRGARAQAAAVRRAWLRKGLDASVGACGGARALAARPPGLERQRPGPNRGSGAKGGIDRVTRVGLIGLGAMGRNHLRVLSDLDGVELVAVCDQAKDMVQAASQKHSIPGYASWEEMLERERLEAAVVAVPTRFHVETGLAALERGLHVLIEKPIATTLDEGRRLVTAARERKRVLAVGHIERFNPAVRELQRRVAAGDIGRIYQIQCRRQGPFPARIRDVGVVIDLATHDLDVMYTLAGSEVQRLYAETERRIHTEHEDILNALLKFDSGMLGVLQVNWLTPTKIREVSVLGERGMFVCNYLTQELRYFRNADVAAADARQH